MRGIISRPDVQRKLQQHLTSESNPFRQPETAAKAHARLREMGYPSLNGGNGHGPTEPQFMLAHRLGWPTEWIFVTHAGKGSGYPNHYKLDIAEPSLQIAIEVDGQSHHSQAIRKKDDKKDAFLMGQGWLVLRFWNEEILNDLDDVERRVWFATSRRGQRTTSLTGSSSITAIA
jgi:hypothetical protein